MGETVSVTSVTQDRFHLESLPLYTNDNPTSFRRDLSEPPEVNFDLPRVAMILY